MKSLLGDRTARRLVESIVWCLPSLLSLIDPNNFLLKVTLTAYYFIVPGLLVRMLIFGKSHKGFNALGVVQTLGLSITFMMAIGYLANVLLPLAGIERPLDLHPFLIIFNLVVYILAFLASNNFSLFEGIQKLSSSKPRISVNKKEISLLILSALILLLSILGATVLNNGGTNYLTITAIVILIAAIFYCLAFQEELSITSLLFFIYFAALSLLLMYSLRSSHVLGFDINKEYYVFRLTQGGGRWLLSNYPNPYNACLSITVLPTLLSNLLHISGEYVYKLLYQVIFAFVPVTMFALYHKLASKNVAMIGAFILMLQVYFSQQLPALARQEIAFLFFALVLSCILVPIQNQGTKVLLFIFSFALIVSHYSTSYFWMFTLLIFYVFYILIKASYPKAKMPARPSIIYLITFILGVVLWYGQVTPTSSNLARFITQLPTSFNTLLSADTLNEDIGKLQLQNINSNTQENLEHNFNQKTEEYKNYKNILPIASQHDYQPQLTFSSTSEGVIAGPIAEIGRGGVLFVYLALAYILEIVGMVVVAKKRKLYQDLVLLDILALACLPLVAMILLVPAIAVDYNLSRAYTQLLMLFAPFAAIALTILYRLIRLKKTFLLTGLLLGLFLFYSSGLYYIAFGGPSYVGLSNSGYDYDKFYTSDSEVMGAVWLSNTRSKNVPVYADTYGALKLHGYASITSTRNELFANVVDKSSYVYLTNTNTNKKITFTTFGNQVIEYTTPSSVLNSSKNTIYSSQRTEILR